MLGTWGLHNNLILRSMIDNIFAYFYHKCKTQNKITPYSSFALLETSVLWNCMIKWENTSNPNFSLCPAGDKCVDCQCKSPLPPGCDCDPGDFFWWFDLIFCFADMLIWKCHIPPCCDCDPGESSFAVIFCFYDMLIWYWDDNVISPWLWLWSRFDLNRLMIHWYNLRGEEVCRLSTL